MLGRDSHTIHLEELALLLQPFKKQQQQTFQSRVHSRVQHCSISALLKFNNATQILYQCGKWGAQNYKFPYYTEIIQEFETPPYGPGFVTALPFASLFVFAKLYSLLESPLSLNVI